MGRVKRAVAVVAVLLVAMAISSCEGEIVKRDPTPRSDGKYKLVYKRKDGAERIVWVTKAEFDACGRGEKWPRCKDGLHNGMRNLPAETNAPRPERGDDVNARTVCFRFTSHPRHRIMYRWYTPRRQGGPRTAEYGNYEKCALAEQGQVVNMSVAHMTGPSTLACSIFVWVNNRKTLIDAMIVQEHATCRVQGAIP